MVSGKVFTSSRSWTNSVLLKEQAPVSGSMKASMFSSSRIRRAVSRVVSEKTAAWGLALMSFCRSSMVQPEALPTRLSLAARVWMVKAGIRL